MKTQNGLVKTLIMFLIGILNTMGLGVLVPSVNEFAKKIEAGKGVKFAGYLPLIIGALLLVAHFTGGLSKEDKEYIEIQTDSVKIKVEIPADTVKPDSIVIHE